MLNLDDLWIGDTVRIKTSYKVCTYMGRAKDGRARVKYREKILLVRAKNLESYEYPEQASQELWNDLPHDIRTPPKSSHEWPSSIDLHIDVLNPTLEHEAPQIILNHQLVKCREYIERSIQLGMKYVTIIHGKGTGQLKREVDHIIEQYDEIRYAIPQNDGGATEIWLK